MSEAPSLLGAQGEPTAPPPGPPETAPAGGDEAPKSPPAESPANGNTPAPKEDAKEPAKTDEPEKAPVANELTIKVPEGLVADKELLDGKFVPLMKELKLPGESAQKIADLYFGIQKAASEKLEQQLAEEDKTFREAAKADKEFGGEKLEANLLIARKSLSQFGSEKLLGRIESLGLGNDPEFIRFCYRVGKALGEDSVAGTTGSSSSSPEVSEDAILRARYPTMFENK